MNQPLPLVVALATAAAITPAASSVGKGYALNDTGVVTCRVAGGVITEQCEGTWTDADFGRDVTHPSSKNGAVGFSFTKLDNAGNKLPKDTPSWACTKDNITGLIWENKRADGSIHDGTKQFDHKTTPVTTLVDATNSEVLCGYTDWRTPSRRELLSLVSASRRNKRLAFIDDKYFQYTAIGTYWTADRWARSDKNLAYWAIGFGSLEMDAQLYSDTTSFYARMVRSDTPYGKNGFKDDYDEIIDEATKLVWKRCVAGQTWNGNTCTGKEILMTGDDARAYSKSQSEISGKNWRLANYKELDSIIDTAKRTAPAIDKTYFPGTFDWKGISLTISQGGLAYSFRDGRTGTIALDQVGTVRLVRDLTDD